MCFRVLLLLGARDQGPVARAGRPDDGRDHATYFGGMATINHLCQPDGSQGGWHEGSFGGDGAQGLRLLDEQSCMHFRVFGRAYEWTKH